MHPLIDTFIEVKLVDSDTEEKARASFLKIRETLTRIGIESRKEKTLYQSCHIFHKRGRYYITHYKEMIALDGREVDFDDSDRARRNTIAELLEEWNLLEIVSPREKLEPKAGSDQKIRVLHFDEKRAWRLVPKYQIGRKK